MQERLAIHSGKPAFEVYNMKNAFITLDQAFDYVGDNSSYQQRITLLLSMQFLLYSFFVMGMPYLFQPPQFYCNSVTCSEQQACKLTNQETRGFDSITKEFHLYCGQQSSRSLIAAMFFFGQMVGGFTFPILANIFGRRIALLLGSLIGALSIIAAGLSQNLLMLYSFFFTAGLGLSGYETVVYVYITEISALRFRSIASSVLVVVWSSSMLIYPFIVDEASNWRQLMLFSIGIPLLILVCISYFFYVESPRWLAQEERYDECRSVFKFMSIFNHRKPFAFNFVQEMDRFNGQCVQIKSNQQLEHYVETLKVLNNFGYCTLFRHSKLLKITFILVCMWFLRYFTYFGLQFSVSTYDISITTAVRILASVELLTALSSFYFKLKFRRIVSLQFCLMCMILSCSFTFIRIPSECQDTFCYQELMHLFSAILLKAAITFYNSLLNTYTGEVYVTSVRSYGYGFCMTFGQLGSSLAPVYVQYIEAVKHASPITIIGGLAFIVVLLTLLLPETFNTQSLASEQFYNTQDDMMASQMFPHIPQLEMNKETELTQFNKLEDEFDQVQ